MGRFTVKVVPESSRDQIVGWLMPSRRQTSGAVAPFPRSPSACRSRPTICSVLRRFFI